MHFLQTTQESAFSANISESIIQTIMLKQEKHALAQTSIDVHDFGDRGEMSATLVTMNGKDFKSRLLGIPPTVCLIEWNEQKYTNPFVGVLFHFFLWFLTDCI